jgi:ABC-2 type transport system ATP-binding protein
VVSAIETKVLRRTFETAASRKRPGRARVALDDVSLAIEPGEIHGLLGPNGAGKTTLCKILSTVLVPTSGEARVLGHDVVAEAKRVRPLIGVVFGGERGLYSRLTARQNLRYWCGLYGLRRRQTAARVDELLDLVGLTEYADERAEKFSRGTKQRLHLARGLVHRPRVLLLDEPTAGLDPVAALQFRQLVLDLRADGVTMLVTTHDMAEAERVCDRVTLVDDGRILASEAPSVLGEWITRFRRVEASGVAEATLERVQAIPGVTAVREQDRDHVLIEVSDDAAVETVLRCLVDSGVSTLAATRLSLEDVYLQVFSGRGMAVTG